MPAELLELHDTWGLGTYLAGDNEDVPPGGFRVTRNVRVDRTRGAICSRPGSSQMTNLAIDGTYTTSLYLSKLFGSAADYHYIQLSSGAATRLYRLNSSWTFASATLLATDATTQGMFDANWIDGKQGLWKYGTNGLRQWKDSGTLFQAMGIAAPAQPPASVTKGSRLSLQLQSCDDSTDFTYANTFATATDATVKQEGTAATRIEVAGGSIATAAIGFTGSAAFLGGTDDSGVNDKPNRVVDTGNNFVTLGVKLGSIIHNTTDGSTGTITRIGTTTNPNDTLFIDGLLAGGSGNDFDNGDAYEIDFNLATFEVVFVSGTDNSGVNNKATTLTDTTKNFLTAGVLAGMTVWNTSNGSKATITGVAETVLTFTAGLAGSSENDFDNGDGYKVVNDLVADDDYIRLWVHTTTPENLDFLQLDFDLDTASVANAFISNYYTVRLPSSIWLNQGANQWTELFVRKAEFTRIGTSTADWSAVKAFRLTMHEGAIGSCTFRIDDLSLVGGYGIEGDYQYIAVYGNTVTGCRSAPPKFTYTVSTTQDVAEQLIPTATLKDVKRHPVVVDLSNIDNPADTQVNAIRLYRKGGTLVNWTLVTVVFLSGFSGTFTDTYADSMIALNEIMEIDNDPPPSDLVTLMGPGAVNRLFGISKRNRLHYSKSWQDDESRGENWPVHFYVTIGDGSSEAMHGAVEDTNIFVWTRHATYMVVGQSGSDVFVPVPLPQSAGLASRWGVAVGAGQVFFLAKDGIYSQKGAVQRKLTWAINPFFNGTTVDGVLPISQALIGECRLVYYPNPSGDEVVLSYSTDGLSVNRLLTLKRHPQTGEFTECFFDDYTSHNGRALYVDLKNTQLLRGSDASRVYQLELDSLNTDDSVAITVQARTGAYLSQAPRLHKDYKDAIVELNTGGTLLQVTAHYNKGTVTETLSAGLAGSTDAFIAHLTMDAFSEAPDAIFHSVAFDFLGNSQTRITIFKIGFHYLPRPEDRPTWDSGEISFDTTQRLWKVVVDLDAGSATNANLYLDGSHTAANVQAIAGATGRRVVTLEYPADTLMRAKVFRLTLVSVAVVQLYDATGWFRPEPEDVEHWDSGEVSFDTTNQLWKLVLDLKSTADATVRLYLDGSTTAFDTQTIDGSTSRRVATLEYPPEPLARAKTFRFTVDADDPLQVWDATGWFRPEPEDVAYWSSGRLTFDHVHALKRLDFDIDAPADVDLTVSVAGQPISPALTIVATDGRQRVDVPLRAGIKGTDLMVECESASPMQVWGLIARIKAWGRPSGYQESPLKALNGAVAQHKMLQMSRELTQRKFSERMA